VARAIREQKKAPVRGRRAPNAQLDVCGGSETDRRYNDRRPLYSCFLVAPEACDLHGPPLGTARGSRIQGGGPANTILLRATSSESSRCGWWQMWPTPISWSAPRREKNALKTSTSPSVTHMTTAICFFMTGYLLELLRRAALYLDDSVFGGASTWNPINAPTTRCRASFLASNLRTPCSRDDRSSHCADDSPNRNQVPEFHEARTRLTNTREQPRP